MRKWTNGERIGSDIQHVCDVPIEGKHVAGVLCWLDWDVIRRVDPRLEDGLDRLSKSRQIKEIKEDSN